ncbi:hypothetical protein Emin_0283 [Elusimicrobium minutum Pei191]|uniref:Winged helix DNA-binding domain-containing protein n=1 Tax=Elusimicrobium minutum (strain Pei191) TaxID=445932 RepID=B2KBU0_ELUMP|nr:crosslink repair DNA glycosylase YcaQ family protein [Elusimicrobium minutum]ACC97844.1 hypothetical protein Emin_0283 [Elusimicrobium minutum Pei191]
MNLTREQIFYLRISKSGLSEPFDCPLSCAKNLLGIQSQAQQFGEISIFNRVKNLKEGGLTSFFKNKNLIKLWGQRMTVHTYHKDDWRFIYKIYGGGSDRLESFLKSDNKHLQTVLKKIESKDIWNKKELQLLAKEKFPHITHFYLDTVLIMYACYKGVLFAVPERPYSKTFLLRKQIVSDKEFKTWNAENKEDIMADLMLRYFACYGPASFKDFLHWSGLRKMDAAKSFEKIKNGLEEFTFNKTSVYLTKKDKHFADLKKSGVKNVIKLLGKFDPLFVAYSDKTWAMDTKHNKHVWRPAAHVEAVLLIGTEAAGTWLYEMKGNNMNFNFNLFKTITAEDKLKIKKEASLLCAFMGKNLGLLSYKKAK